MTRRRGELRLQILGALFDGEREITAILSHIKEPLDGRRKCEIVLGRLQNDGLVSRQRCGRTHDPVLLDVLVLLEAA